MTTAVSPLLGGSAASFEKPQDGTLEPTGLRPMNYLFLAIAIVSEVIATS